MVTKVIDKRQNYNAQEMKAILLQRAKKIDEENNLRKQSKKISKHSKIYCIKCNDVNNVSLN